MCYPNINKYDIIFIVGVVVLPLSSIQHFVWPVSWCLLADICNHTFIPECGHDEMEDRYRTFTDECDMFEFNCDNEKDFEWINYSECFLVRTCPTAPPCPTRRPCRTSTVDLGRKGRKMASLAQTVPLHMMNGKRRYTPEKWRKRAHTEPYAKTTKTAVGCRSCGDNKPAHTFTKFTGPTVVLKTEILKKETYFRNGKKLLKVIKSVAYKKGKPNPGKAVPKGKKKVIVSRVIRRKNYLRDSSSDFLE